MTRRALPGGFELDDDPSRLDLDAIFAFLSTESYWGFGFSEPDFRVMERRRRDPG